MPCSDKRARCASASSGVLNAPACTKYINGSAAELVDLGSAFDFIKSLIGSELAGLGAVLGAATEGLKEPATTGGAAEAVALDADLAGFSGGIAGAVLAALGLAAGAVPAAAGVVAVVAPGALGATAAPGTTGGVGLAGFLPDNAAFGSQSLFFLDSVASASTLWFCILLLKGDGVLVTNTATAKAAAKPSTTPIIKPNTVPPRCLFIVVCMKIEN